MAWNPESFVNQDMCDGSGAGDSGQVSVSLTPGSHTHAPLGTVSRSGLHAVAACAEAGLRAPEWQSSPCARS